MQVLILHKENTKYSWFFTSPLDDEPQNFKVLLLHPAGNPLLETLFLAPSWDF